MTEYGLPISNTHTQFQCSCKSKISTLCRPIYLYREIRLMHPILIIYFIRCIEISAYHVSTNNRVNVNMRINVRETI